MSAFVEFALVAVILFLWESTLWLPLRSYALRRRWRGGTWRVLDTGAWFAGRETGMIPLLPLPPDTGLAPCQVPPLLVGGEGSFLIDLGNGMLLPVAAPSWDDLHRDGHHLLVGGRRVRISSPRCMDLLRRARLRGATVEAAVRQSWRIALSPGRAGREWRRWRLVSGALRYYAPVLTIGFFVGLPMAYVYLGSMWTLVFALWLWSIMAMISAHLWWLSKRVYPDARGALRMDAMLSLIVPFHAMRALEIAAVHAMGLTHSAALVLSTRDFGNPWLAAFIRGLLHPRPGVAEDAVVSSAVLPSIERYLAKAGVALEKFDAAPDTPRDEDARRYCPRCQASYHEAAAVCTNCRGLPLRKLS